jgi:hypothetical protein
LVLDLEICLVLVGFGGEGLLLGAELHQLVLVLLQFILDCLDLAGVELTVARVVALLENIGVALSLA